MNRLSCALLFVGTLSAGPATIRFSEIYATAGIVAPDGSVAISGTKSPVTYSDYDATLQSISPEGSETTLFTHCVAQALGYSSEKNLELAGDSMPSFALEPYYTRHHGCFERLSSAGVSLLSVTLPTKVIQTSFGTTIVRSFAKDAAGNIYLAGQTSATEFDVTPNAFQTTGPRASGTFGDSFDYFYAFVTKLSPDGEILFSTLLGGSKVNCNGGSHCISINPLTRANTIAVDAAGDMYVGGETNAVDFPATPGTVNSVCTCAEFAGMGFVARFKADGTFDWATLVGNPAHYFDQLATGGSRVLALQPDANGNVYLAVQDSIVNAADAPTRGPQFSTLRLSPDAKSVFSSLPVVGTVNSAAFATSGDLWVTGVEGNQASDFVPTGVKIGNAFVSHLNVVQPHVIEGAWLPADAMPPAISVAADGKVAVVQPSGSVIPIIGNLPLTGVLGIANSFESHVASRIAPGELVGLFGNTIGPATAMSGRLGSDRRLETQIGGIQVWFDQIEAPLLYAGPNQINAVVPFEVAGKTSVTVAIKQNGTTLSSFIVPVVNAQPAIANVQGIALAIDQDGTLNSSDHPATPGSIITIWAEGAGSMNPEVTGGIVNVTGVPVLPVKVIPDVDTLYLGQAPGLLSGTLQVNFRVPLVPSGLQFEILLQAGSTTSEPVYIWIAKPLTP